MSYANLKDPIISPSSPNRNEHKRRRSNKGDAKGDALLSINSEGEPPHLTWDGLTFQIKEKKGLKTIIANVSGEAKPGEMIAIMGPSGAGKTTLIKMLSGRVDSSPLLSGRVLLNGRKRNANFIHQSAYVTQKDHLLPNLTVRETLMFTARLRLPSSVSYDDKVAAVDRVIQQLGLKDCQDTLVGGTSLVPGVSGGERRRVSIGVEMMTNPNVMFLDEPTSGLDASTAFRVARRCQQLAKEHGRVVMMCIHQPKASIYRMFDKIILMAQGQVAFQGTPDEAMTFFAKMGLPLPEQTNPADFYMDCLTLDLETAKAARQSQNRVSSVISAWKKEYREQKKIEREESAKEGFKRKPAEFEERLGYPNGLCTEIAILFRRNWTSALREKTLTIYAVLQSLVFGVLIGAIYWDLGLSQVSVQNRNGALFFVCLNQAFGPMFQVINVFLQEKAVFHNEYFSGSYRVLTYFLAKNVSEIPLQITPPVLFATIVYWMVGFQQSLDKFLQYLLLVVVTAMVSQSIGLCVAAAVTRLEVATAVTPVIIILFMLFAGFYVNVGTLSVVFEWVKWISYIQWSYRGFCQNEFNGLKFTCTENDNGCYDTGEQILKYLDFEDFDICFSLPCVQGPAQTSLFITGK
eukprot:g58890.t1